MEDLLAHDLLSRFGLIACLNRRDRMITRVQLRLRARIHPMQQGIGGTHLKQRENGGGEHHADIV